MKSRWMLSAAMTAVVTIATLGCDKPGIRFFFRGFDLWTWSRQDIVGLADFVLHDIWGMNRAAPAAPAPRTAIRPGHASPGNAPPTAPGRGARR